MAFLRAFIVGALMTASLLTAASLLMAAGFGGSAYAQQQQDDKTPMQLDEERKKKEAEQIDKQYKATVQKTNRNPVENAANDPWQNMRGSADTKAKR